MHIDNENSLDLDAILTAIERMDRTELQRVQEAASARRKAMAESNVTERRAYRGGILQLETRSYRRKDGGLTQRGPYWYFHYREGGEQKTLYIGKVDDPESKVDEKLGEEAREDG
jgi:hypothetical protein